MVTFIDKPVDILVSLCHLQKLPFHFFSGGLSLVLQKCGIKYQPGERAKLVKKISFTRPKFIRNMPQVLFLLPTINS